ncbi:MAG: hypothetical protein Q9186_002520 [Xanthomendoza sp. 1 TL-2023]
MTTTSSSSSPSLISPTTLLSLLSSLTLLLLAILLSRRLLPRPTPSTHLYLHTWHLFDFLIHTLFEGSYLYHSFFTYTPLPPSSNDYPHPASLGPSSSSQKNQGSFLGHRNRRYGAAHSTSSPTALLWQEYARADTRWANTDTTIISIELLTVFIAGPLALYICYLLQRHQPHPPSRTRNDRAARSTNNDARLWLPIIILATGELYGGFMTFAPEWLLGNPNLQTDNPMYLWLYLVFFNGLWVVMPLSCLWVAATEIGRAYERNEDGGKKGR